MIKTEAKGKARIYRKDYDGKAKYQTQLSKKDMDGNWTNGYIGIQFNKGVELSDKTDIDITNAWIDFYLTKDNKTVPFIRCTQFEQIGGAQPAIPEGFMALEDDSDIAF